MSDGEVLTKRDGDIATVVLSAPDRLNALSLPMWQGLAAAIGQLDADSLVAYNPRRPQRPGRRQQ